jgi:hypothetical protein
VTLLCGDPTLSTYTPVGPAASDGVYIAPIPFVALSSGSASSLNCYLSPAAPMQFVMALYDGTGQRLVYSAPQTVTSAGLVAFPISPTVIVQGQAYQIALIPQTSGNYQFGTDTAGAADAFRIAGANSTFPVPPYQLGTPVATIYGAPTFFADGDAQAQTLVPSGQIGQATLTTSQVIQNAFRRCKIRASLISDEMIEIARSELFMFLTSDLASRGIQLFAVDIVLLPFTDGLAGVPMPAGTIDVLNANLRYMNAIQSSASPTFTAASPTNVNCIAITWAGPAVPFQVLINGSVFKSVVPNASAGQTTLVDLDGATAATSWAIQANPVPAQVYTSGPLLVSNVVFYNTLFQVPMAPYSRDDFANLSNFFFKGRPFQYWLDRQEPWPIMRLWPTPGSNEQNNACLVIWRKRQIMDIGALSGRLDIPNRWLEAVTDGLASRLAYVIQEVNPTIIPTLETKAAMSLKAVKEEERENAPMRIQPRIYAYTR